MHFLILRNKNILTYYKKILCKFEIRKTTFRIKIFANLRHGNNENQEKKKFKLFYLSFSLYLLLMDKPKYINFQKLSTTLYTFSIQAYKRFAKTVSALDMAVLWLDKSRAYFTQSPLIQFVLRVGNDRVYTQSINIFRTKVVFK